MDLQLRNKVVLITGGAKGIGAAIAKACAVEGAIPVIVDRDQAAGQHLRSALSAKAGVAHFLQGDLTEAHRRQDVIQQTVALNGHLDRLVNNAGINDKVGLGSGDPDQFIDPLREIYCTTTTWPTIHLPI